MAMFYRIILHVTINFYIILKWNVLLLYLGKFTQKVWQMLAYKVDFGCMVSYGELAEMCSNPKAAQAVGQAMKNNPVMILVPCHRVILSSGSIGNYSGGKRNLVKQWLLKHEGAIKG